MKISIFELLLISLCFSPIYTASAQSLKDTLIQTVPEQVEEYFEFFKSYKNGDEMLQDMASISLERIKDYTRNLYEATETDAILRQRILIQKNKESDSLNLMGRQGLSVPFFPHPSTMERRMLEKIIQELSPLTATLAYIDYFLLIKVQDVFIVEHNLVDHPEAVIHLSTVKADVISVIKGENRFSINDQFIFHYENSRAFFNLFKKEGIYFVSLSVGGNYQDKLWVKIPWQLEKKDEVKPFGVFPVNNGILYDEDNFFGFGTEVEWTEFQNMLKQKIVSIKSF